MKSRVTEIGRTETQAWGVVFVVCTNDETIRDRLDLDGETTRGDAYIRDAMNKIWTGGYDYETESSYNKYHGGPYIDLVTPIYYIADIFEADDDAAGDLDEWRVTWQVGPGAISVPDDISAVINPLLDSIESLHQNS